MVLIYYTNDFSIGFNNFSIFLDIIKSTNVLFMMKSLMKCEIKKFFIKQNLSNHILIFIRIAIIYYESVIIVLYLSITFCFRLLF